MQNKTTILIPKNLRDLIKLRAVQEHITMQLYLERLVMKDMNLESIPR